MFTLQVFLSEKLINLFIYMLFKYTINFYFFLFVLYDCVVPAAYSSCAERNYYQILGVSENASRDEIKKAFHLVSDCCEPLDL
jgi:hypothetical protein